MKLIYVYIEKYRSLKNVNFNFGGRFIFNYDASTKRISCEPNDYYIENFYDVIQDRNANLARIRNVSAIVGENGTGKTTFFDFLKECFVEGSSGFSYNTIVGFEDHTQDGLTIYVSNLIYIDSDSLSQIIGKNIKLIRYTPNSSVIELELLPKLFDRPEGGLLGDEIEDAKRISYIYFSNIFDKKEEIELAGLYNISTNFLLKNDVREKLDRRLGVSTYQFVETHRYSEILREINFINEFKNEYRKYLSFMLPQRLNAAVVSLGDSIDSSITHEGNTIVFLRQLQEYSSRLKMGLTNYQRFLLNLYFTSIYNAIIESYKYSLSVHFNFDKIDLKIDNYLNEDYIILYNKLLDYLIQSTASFDFLNKKFIAIKELVPFLEKYVQEYDNLVSSEQNTFQFNIETIEKQNKFFDFYDLYKQSYNFDPFINFDWADRSTGEKALLNIYSRLYYLSDKEISRRGSNLILNDNIILMIDEGELYLHPTWQKELLFQLLKIVPVIFKKDTNHRNIQIIITSNSPLVITDIPSNNIVFLKKEELENETKIIVQDSLNDQRQTFAANIHTLLSDSFFMKNGMAGEFAVFRINQIIKELSSGSILSNKRREDIRKTIQQIGEPILKNKLLQMYNDKYNLNIHDRIERIEKFLNIDYDKDQVE